MIRICLVISVDTFYMFRRIPVIRNCECVCFFVETLSALLCILFDKKRIVEIGCRGFKLFVNVSNTYLILNDYGLLVFSQIPLSKLDQIELVHA